MTSAHMDDGTAGGVLNSTTEDLMGERGGVTFAEENETHHVGDRADIGPVEVNVRNMPVVCSR